VKLLVGDIPKGTDNGSVSAPCNRGFLPNGYTPRSLGRRKSFVHAKYRRCECTPLVPFRFLEDGKPFVVHLRCTIGDTRMHFPPAIDCEYWLCVLVGNVRWLGQSGGGRRQKLTRWDGTARYDKRRHARRRSGRGRAAAAARDSPDA